MTHGNESSGARVVASVSDMTLSAVQEGRWPWVCASLADLVLLADTLGIDLRDLRVQGTVGVRATALPEEGASS